jgi:LPS-assembly protein
MTLPSRAAPILSLDRGLDLRKGVASRLAGSRRRGADSGATPVLSVCPLSRAECDIRMFDSVLMDRDYDWLFRRNRFVGADRLGDANQLTARLTTRID